MGLLGKILAAPIRLANIPIKILDDVTDPFQQKRLKDRDPIKLDEIADAIEDAVDGRKGK